MVGLSSQLVGDQVTWVDFKDSMRKKKVRRAYSITIVKIYILGVKIDIMNKKKEHPGMGANIKKKSAMPLTVSLNY